MRLFNKIILSFMVLFVIWRFIIGIRYNWNLNNIRIDMYSSFKQLENISATTIQERLNKFVVSWDKFVNDYDTMWNNIGLNVNFSDFWSSIQTIWNTTGIALGRIGNILVSFFTLIFSALCNLILLFVDIIKLIIEILNFILNPVSYTPLTINERIIIQFI